MSTVPVSLAGLGFVAASCLGWTLHRRYAVVDVRGSSMEPTLRHGDRVLVRRVRTSGVRTGGVRTGDIVVIERPGRAARRVWVVKRAAAVAGDPVPGSVAHAAGVAPGTAVPAGRLVVLGDNPTHSTDSRVWGYLPTDRLLGVVRRRMGGR
jgi:signal peptidase I